jgi:glycosyltransferase involved in cell wall biosynthesis
MNSNADRIMDSNPRVSVVVSILNAEQFLAETIESVFAQSLTSWELLLVDDGSDDASTIIARGDLEKSPQKVRYFEHYKHRRRGQGASRNLAITNARGEFIATLDHDDVWLPNKLEHQVAILDLHPEVALVYGATQYWHSWAGVVTDAEPDYVEMPGVPPNRVYEPPVLLKLALSEQIVPPIPTDVMFRKESICNLGGFEESFIGLLSMYEDQAFLVKVFADLPVYVSDEWWDRYRIHPDQQCARVIRSGRKSDTEYFFLNWVSEYLSSRGALDAEIKAIVLRRMWPHHHPLLCRLMQVGPALAGKVKRIGNSLLQRRA